ncbi:hypothetical protein B0H14DRAFT_3740851 [Mycena olivaceomarginata]|nr:hypothetical protein B0H14DRAFT_3740851 [Mycena olivaceomarginata]
MNVGLVFMFGGSRCLPDITARTVVLSETFDFVGEIEKDVQGLVLRVKQFVVLLISMATSVLQTCGILVVATLQDIVNEPVGTATFWERGAGKESHDDSDASDSETAVGSERAPRAVKGPGKSPSKSIARSTANRQGATVLLEAAACPKFPSRSSHVLKESSPAKRPKAADTELHTVDVKSVKELPNVCEVTNPELQDPMMKSIYALDLPKLRRGQVTTWSSNEGPGMFMLSEYPVVNPESIETLWSLLLFVQKGHHINPARIDPCKLEACSPAIPRDLKKRWVLSIGERPAVCVSVVNTTRSSLREISTVYSGSKIVVRQRTVRR